MLSNGYTVHFCKTFASNVAVGGKRFEDFKSKKAKLQALGGAAE
jgi:hypothetical protein